MSTTPRYRWYPAPVRPPERPRFLIGRPIPGGIVSVEAEAFSEAAAEEAVSDFERRALNRHRELIRDAQLRGFR